MAKGKQNKPPTKSATSAEDAPTAPPGPEGDSPYDREPDAGGGALVFLGIIGVLLAGAILVGLLQAS
jgi:hypothetical protein